MNKRGQFFLLSAVIIAAIIATLATTANYVLFNEESKSFYDISSDIRQEGAQVVDYGVFNDDQVVPKIKDFAENIGNYIADADPETEIFFVYGNSSEIFIENYAKSDLIAASGGASGSVLGCKKDINSPIKISVGTTTVTSNPETTLKDYYGLCRTRITTSGSNENVTINISNQIYNFSLGTSQKFLIITKKQLNNETYISAR